MREIYAVNVTFISVLSVLCIIVFISILETNDWCSEFVNGSIVCWSETWSAAKNTKERGQGKFSTAKYNVVSRQNSRLNRGSGNQASAHSKASLAVSSIGEMDETIDATQPIAQPKPMPRTRSDAPRPGNISVRSNYSIRSDDYEV